ncbi:MAG: thioredoxin domain-containing protein [Candidatus Omnitrophica bacterium]|nr:thioredoxin domain-containing protein [Candidatus Omnitrophota bacterium]
MTSSRKKKNNGGPSKTKLAIVIISASLLCLGVGDYIYRHFHSPIVSFTPQRTSGDPGAVLQIVEFVDYTCINCVKGHKILKKYLQEYPKAINVTVKYFPLGELNSMISALHAECAAQQDKFWPMHDMLFERQFHWRTLVEVEPYLTALAKKISLDIDQLKGCLEDPAARSTLIQEKTLGESYFVQMTPTYFINRKMVVGSEELEDYLHGFFEQYIEW